MKASGPRTLRARLARWMLLSTLVTLAVFASALFVAFALEQDDEPVADGTAAEPLSEEAGEQMMVALAIAAPLALLAAVGGAALLSRRALAPLDAVIATARSISPGDLHTRLELPPHRDELHALVTELNALFERLQLGFEALGRHAVDAAHELRTPLAVMAAELDVAVRKPRSEVQWRSVAGRTRGEIGRLSRLVESLLALARADGPLERALRMDLRETVDGVLSAMCAQADAEAVSLCTHAGGGDGPCWLRGDPDAIDAAIRNLVTNAIQHSPCGARVDVSVLRHGEGFEVVVDDQGPGVALDEQELIFQPLRRGTQPREDRNPRGHGLGLAIAARIAWRHGGDIRVERSPRGGARFVMRLRAATPCAGGEPT